MTTPFKGLYKRLFLEDKWPHALRFGTGFENK